MTTSASFADLPMGFAPDPLPFPHFPDRLHAYVWRNWPLVPTNRLASVVGAYPEDIVEIGRSMGLSGPPVISAELRRRSYITVLRRNWHLLPYEQLGALLGWTADQMAFTLREGDGLFWWFGQYKPKLEPLRYAPPTADAQARAREIAAIALEVFPKGADAVEDPPFGFVKRLSVPLARDAAAGPESLFSPRYCFSYFGTFRAPLSAADDPYPDGYLARLAAAGLGGVWLHEPLYRLAPFPWDPEQSRDYKVHLDKLGALVARAAKHGLGVYLYFNEPRPMPVAFFDAHPELRGVIDTDVLPGQVATLCTSVPEVRDYLRDGVATLCEAVPELAGIFTITASENYTNCWSHGHGERCPRCGQRTPEEVIAEVNTTLAEGIARAGSACQLIVWDWGWKDAWVEGIIARLPATAALQSVSEWCIPIERGGVKSEVGEYSLSVVGPGPRALRHWKLARDRGLKIVAKIQAGNSWELAATPYVPVVETVARHAANLRDAHVDGLMLSWTLGGYPSPNFEAVIEMGRPGAPGVDEVLQAVAARRYGATAAPAVAAAWKAFSAAFNEFPFDIRVLYHGPMHLGPANLLWGVPTGYAGRGTMAFAYPVDDLDTWRGIYPAETFIAQLDKVATGFNAAIETLTAALGDHLTNDLLDEVGVAQACAVHLCSAANQGRFVLARDRLAQAGDATAAGPLLEVLDGVLRSEIALAAHLHALQGRDSRIGFEAACQYFYIGIDLAEKVLNARHLLTTWLPAQRERFGLA